MIDYDYTLILCHSRENLRDLGDVSMAGDQRQGTVLCLLSLNDSDCCFVSSQKTENRPLSFGEASPVFRCNITGHYAIIRRIWNAYPKELEDGNGTDY